MPVSNNSLVSDIVIDTRTSNGENTVLVYSKQIIILWVLKLAICHIIYVCILAKFSKLSTHNLAERACAKPTIKS